LIEERALSTADLANGSLANGHATAEIAGRISLFPENELGDLRRSWQETQGGFVDDPKTSVRKADELVASLMTRLAQIFADERGKHEHEWDKGDSVSTEDLRLALQRYRSFFDRLLSV
jgi:hypothetical protein